MRTYKSQGTLLETHLISHLEKNQKLKLKPLWERRLKYWHLIKRQ